MNATVTIDRDGKAFYTALDYQWAETDTEFYSGCRDGFDPTGVRRSFLGTTTYWEGSRRYQMIRLCPQYLSYIAANRLWSSSQVDPGWLVDVPEQASQHLDKLHYTSIDLYAQLEKTILHELTHTFQVRAIDYPQSHGFIRASTLPGVAAFKNAETLAFMGLISKLAQLGFKVDVSGNLHPIPAELPGKRSFVNSPRFDIDD